MSFSEFAVTIKPPKRKNSIRYCLVYYYRGKYRVAYGKSTDAHSIVSGVNRIVTDFRDLLKPHRAPVAFIRTQSDNPNVEMSDIMDARVWMRGEPPAIPQITPANIHIG